MAGAAAAAVRRAAVPIPSASFLIFLLLLLLRVRRKREAAGTRSANRAVCAGTSMNKILEKNLEPRAAATLTRRRSAVLPAAVAAPLCGRAANPGTDQDKDKSPAWCRALRFGSAPARRP